MTLDSYVPFSVRSGLAQPPPQLKLGEASKELRNLIYSAIYKEIECVKKWGPNASYFDGPWKEVAIDFHVRFLCRPLDEFENSPWHFGQNLKKLFFQCLIGTVFDATEHFLRHRGCSPALREDIAAAFVNARAAYRVLDGVICAIGTDEQAQTFVVAVNAAGATGARKHLLDASKELKNGKWAASVRESIHAVESVAIFLAPGTKELGPALKALEQQGHLHGSLKAAFGSLYGYASDEKGVRHARGFRDDTNVDEADALFMLGACAAFVSYALTRATAIRPAAAT